MWQQKRHLVHRQWELARPVFFVPHLWMGRRVDRLRHKFVPRIWKDAAFRCDRAEQSIEHEKSARYRPAVTNAGSHAAPIVTAEARTRGRDKPGDLFDRFRVD